MRSTASTQSLKTDLERFLLTCTSISTQLSQAGHVTLFDHRGKGERTAGTFLYWRVCLGVAGQWGEGRLNPPTSSLAAGASLSQLLAIGAGVNHLMCILAHPDRRPIGVGLLGLKRAMHLGTVAAALTRPGGGGVMTKKQTNESGDVKVAGLDKSEGR